MTWKNDRYPLPQLYKQSRLDQAISDYSIKFDRICYQMILKGDGNKIFILLVQRIPDFDEPLILFNSPYLPLKAAEEALAVQIEYCLGLASLPYNP